MKVLKIKDWLLIKNGAQFKAKLKLTNDNVVVATRIFDGVEFSINSPMTYINNGDWNFIITYFWPDNIHVECTTKRPDNSHSNSFYCEINDIKIKDGIIYSLVDRTVSPRKRRRVIAKK